MASPKTVELAGQSLVMTKLARLGYLPSLTPVNSPSVDIQAYHLETKQQILVQVKSVREGNDWQQYGSDFLLLEQTKDADGRYFTEAKGLLPLPEQTIFWAFAKLSNNVCPNCGQTEDKLYIAPLREVQKIADIIFRKNLEPNERKGKKQGYRVHGGNSTHFTITEADLAQFTDWNILRN